MSWDFNPQILKGKWVQLEPMNEHLYSEVCQSMIPDPTGWYSVMFGLNTPEAYRDEFSSSDTYRENKTGIGFVIRDLKSSEVAGISFFLRMDSENRTLEIGTTNIAPRFRKTYVNTATKLILLENAFEKLKCIRVSFRVDEENLISKKAIERIGATYGGILRHERILPDGRIRDYLFYSIIYSEWPQIKARLISLLR